MSRREVIAYAITHAPKGVKGGPYTGNGSTANQVPSMALARRYALEDLHEAQADVAWLVRNEYTARVIRIVRKVRPSEASATPPIGHRDGGRLETARRLLAAVAEHMTEHAYQELASALGVDACRVGPSEASAVEVLRELVAWDGGLLPCFFSDVLDRARAVLAASGPDPMPVVRAAMEETDAEEAFSAAPHCGRRGEAAALDAAARARVDAVDAYREAGGK
jgi:hypothetical protein